MNIKRPLLLVLSADHLIENPKAFVKSITSGIKYALKNYLVTFGIIPDYPETGYGYIKSKSSISNGKIMLPRLKISLRNQV